MVENEGTHLKQGRATIVQTSFRNSSESISEKKKDKSVGEEGNCKLRQKVWKRIRRQPSTQYGVCQMEGGEGLPYKGSPGMEHERRRQRLTDLGTNLLNRVQL